MDDRASKRLTGPSRKWYAIGALLVVVPVAGVLFAVVIAVFAIDARMVAFKAPGSATFTVATPQTYVVWNQVVGVYEGAFIDNTDQSVGAVTITITDAATGAEVGPVVEKRTTWMEINEARRQSLATVEIASPGDYRVEIATAEGEAFIAAVSPAVGPTMLSILRAFTLPAILAGVAVLVGLPMLVITFVRRFAAAQRRREAEYEEIRAGF